MKPLYTRADWTREQPTEDDPSYRSPFRRDYARLLHSPAFRRLQGKTQLFPSEEHDFFRNRLTHSLEVAQVAKSIALRLNHSHSYFREHPIDTDLVETAALAHDLGHPPFGHIGERALDDCMKGWGGFEGNAQSLRILAKLSKKEGPRPVEEPPQPVEVGLNLTHRSLAAILKYDRTIPMVREQVDPLVKGFYETESDLVERMKTSVLRGKIADAEFKTIECQIMDLADDIAYSTYDLEDALKADFVSPMKMILAMLKERVYKPILKELEIDRVTLFKYVMDIWLEPVFDPQSLGFDIGNIDLQNGQHLALLTAAVYDKARGIVEDGKARTELTSHLINECIEGTDVSVDEEYPSLSKVQLKSNLLMRVKILKRMTYSLVIESPKLKTVEYRGNEIVQDVFDALSSRGGDMLMPDDYRERVVNSHGKAARARAICDFIAGMTDRYAIEFYGRLRSESAQTIFKPL